MIYRDVPRVESSCTVVRRYAQSDHLFGGCTPLSCIMERIAWYFASNHEARMEKNGRK